MFLLLSSLFQAQPVSTWTLHVSAFVLASSCVLWRCLWCSCFVRVLCASVESSRGVCVLLCACFSWCCRHLLFLLVVAGD